MQSQTRAQGVPTTKPCFPFALTNTVADCGTFRRSIVLCSSHFALTRDPLPDRARGLILEHCLYENGNRLDLHAVVVMPDHVHLLFTPLSGEDGWPYPLPKILKIIKGTLAHAINKLLGSCGPVWQDESFDHVLRPQESLKEKIDYIRMNPVRAGLVNAPDEYKWLWIQPCR
jgi:REP element-mobilizing transposase RayT